MKNKEIVRWPCVSLGNRLPAELIVKHGRDRLDEIHVLRCICCSALAATVEMFSLLCAEVIDWCPWSQAVVGSVAALVKGGQWEFAIHHWGDAPVGRGATNAAGKR